MEKSNSDFFSKEKLCLLYHHNSPCPPSFSPYPESTTGLWLESMRGHSTFLRNLLYLVLERVFAHDLLLIFIIIPQGRYFCHHFTDETKTERFQGTSISTSLLPLGKSVGKLR